MNHIKIFNVKIDHLESLGSLFDQYRQFYNQAPDVDRSLSFIKERIERQDSVIFIALNESDKVLGFAQLYPSYSSISTGKKWILNDVFVSASSRRLGIAKMLMQRVEKLAIETGATSIFLEVQVNNENAQHLYKSFGYIEETEHYSYFLEVNK